MRVVSAHVFKNLALLRRDRLNADAGPRRFYWVEKSPTRRLRKWEVKTNAPK